ncbi:DUF6341 family protein [Polaribacter uvawellassae]|uniref:DUF6341 family protein n=1 Tax=Polaribacter uvawellassae TaxID=3133495 RepID=UPI00321ADF5F
MIASNIFRLIGDFFTWAFAPFEALRLSDLSWWASNAVSWLFIAILFVLFGYWMKESARFKREGIEDSAE